MSGDLLSVTVSAINGRAESKLQNISGMTYFSDLLVLCREELKRIDTIVNEEERVIYVIGNEIGSAEEIKAIVDEDYNIADICFNQKLFISKPMIHFVFDYFKVEFAFDSAGTKNKWRCSLQYLCGSKSFGREVLKGINTKKDSIHWKAKLTEDYYIRHCDTGMRSEKFGLKSGNCVVFVVNPHPSTSIRSDVLIFLDTVALQSKTDACQMVVLFRQAEYLRSQLKDFVKEPLIEDTFYLLMFRKIRSSVSSSSCDSSVAPAIEKDNISSRRSLSNNNSANIISEKSDTVNITLP